MSERESLIERLRKLVETGKSYAKSELNGAPTSTFEIYMGHFAAITDEIAAALSSMEAGAKVKALEWEHVPRGEYSGVTYRADTILGEYLAQKGAAYFDNQLIKAADYTLAAAKAAAQADYERRILSALEPSPAPVPAGARVTDEMVEPSRKMVDGCCSAISPCSHQQRDPYSICDICAQAGRAPSPDMGKAVEADEETIKARAASVLCEAGTLCGWPAPNCNAREGAEALYKAGLLKFPAASIARTALARLDTEKNGQEPFGYVKDGRFVSGEKHAVENLLKWGWTAVYAGPAKGGSDG